MRNRCSCTGTIPGTQFSTSTGINYYSNRQKLIHRFWWETWRGKIFKDNEALCGCVSHESPPGIPLANWRCILKGEGRREEEGILVTLKQLATLITPWLGFSPYLTLPDNEGAHTKASGQILPICPGTLSSYVFTYFRAKRYSVRVSTSVCNTPGLEWSAVRRYVQKGCSSRVSIYYEACYRSSEELASMCVYFNGICRWQRSEVFLLSRIFKRAHTSRTPLPIHASLSDPRRHVRRWVDSHGGISYSSSFLRASTGSPQLRAIKQPSTGASEASRNSLLWWESAYFAHTLRLSKLLYFPPVLLHSIASRLDVPNPFFIQLKFYHTWWVQLKT